MTNSKQKIPSLKLFRAVVKPHCSLTSFLVIGILFFMGFTSCVTVNVNFPEGAVQAAADDYVQNLYRTRTTAKEKSKVTPSEEKVKAPGSSSYFLFGISTALADDLKLKLQSESIRQIFDRQSQRVDQLIYFKNKGIFGESARGLLSLRDPKALVALPKKERASAESLLVKENEDRERLYMEALKEMGASASDTNALNIVRQHFANAFKNASEKGQWIEVDLGNWIKK